MPETKRKGSESQRLHGWLQQHENEMAALLAELIAVPTENPPGSNYAECVDLLENRLRQLGLPCERLVAKDASGKPSNSECLSASYGRGSRTLYFHGHYDVVPAQSPEQFRPVRRDNFVFGRGSCDMKGGIVAMVYAVLALRECTIDLDGQIKLILVPDEETAGKRGSAWLAKEGLLGIGGVGMLTAEPTSGVVWNANRGAISVRVEVFGKSAHVGLQHKGVNAFERMLQVVARFQKLQQEVEQRVTPACVGIEQSRNSILLIGGVSGGGSNFNVVPEKCWFTLDRRINPEEDLEVEKQTMVDILEEWRREGISLEWETLQEGRSAISPKDSAGGQVLASAIQEITGHSASFEMCPGLLETRFYASAGVLAYAYGPGALSVAHGPNEFVDLRKMAESAAVYADVARRVLNPTI